MAPMSALVAIRAWQGALLPASVRTGDGRRRWVRGNQIHDTFLVRRADHGLEWPGWDLSVPFRGGRELVAGRDAARTTARLLRRVNGAGAASRTVREAVSLVEEVGHPDPFLRGFIRERAAPSAAPDFILANRRGVEVNRRGLWSKGVFVGSIALLRPDERLALELVFHEEQERRAMEGELVLLEEAWREAEEIAAIADGLLTPLEPTGGA